MEMPTRRAPEDQRRTGSVGGWWRMRMVSTVDGGRVWVPGEERVRHSKQ